MKLVDHAIHRLPVSHRGDWVLLQLWDEQGNCGWGEASNSGDDDVTVAEIERQMAALGSGAQDIPALRGRLAATAPADKPRRTAFSAIEHAVTDLAARRDGLSVAAILAAAGDAPRTRVPVYANVNRMCRDRAPDIVAAAGRTAVAAGLSRVKFAPFDEVSPDRLPAEGSDIAMPGVERLRALRDAIGRDTELMVDCHWRFTPDTVAVLAATARELDISWIEDPLPDFEPSQIQRLRDLSGARVAGGEALLVYEDFERLAASGAVDVLIADVKFIGGIGQLDRICKMAAAHGVAFAPHNPSGPISTAASAHAVAANPNALVLEYSFGEVGWRGAVAVGETVVGDGVAVCGPGLGVTVDLAAAGPPAL